MERGDIRQSSRASATERSGGENGAGVSLQTLGSLLRERRERAGITLEDVEKVTRIRKKYLVALEADEWHLLPGEVVGRGFLRNYASFLNLDPDEMIERRRAAVDPSLHRILANTSAESQLPPVREVDYRPKDVDLVETPVTEALSEYVAVGRDWFAPVLTAVAVVLAVVLLIWGFSQIGGRVGDLVDALQGRTDALVQGVDAPTPGDVNRGVEGGAGGPVAPAGDVGQQDPANAGGVALAPTDTPTFTPEPPTPTPTFTPEPPTATPTFTPVPLPTATFTPVPLPTPTPVPAVAPVVEEPVAEAPAVVPPSCPDPRAVITSPGVNQVVSGPVTITGTAIHDQFDYYKLEFAPGANAEGGFGYFDGAAGPVNNGVLGVFNSGAVPNGAYTIQLTVVDTTGNYPPPCRVTITVQN